VASWRGKGVYRRRGRREEETRVSIGVCGDEKRESEKRRRRRAKLKAKVDEDELYESS